MSNKNKAAKSKESKQRTKAANKKSPTKRYTKRTDRADINAVQLAFLKMVVDKPYVAEEAICHGTTP